MAQIKTAISIDERLFTQAEETARELNLTRSGLYARALAEFLRKRDQDRLTEQLNAVYDGTLDPEDEALLRKMQARRLRLAAEDPWR